MNDKTLIDHIGALVAEEQRLQGEGAASDEAHKRIRHIEEQLDQCWDLLRQRRAARETGHDPADAHLRPPEIVDGPPCPETGALAASPTF